MWLYQFWSRKWQHTLAFLPGKFHGQRNLADYSPRVTELGTTEHTHTPISIPNNTVQGWHLLYTLTSLLLFLVLTIAKLYLIVFLICISRAISSIKNSLIYILAVYMSSLEKCRIRFFADFFLNYLVFCSDCMKRLCILDMNTLAESLQIFSHSTCYLFTVFFLFMCRTSLI